ncbi:Crp/Fnr family transcriptional regulator [Mesorhizobium sp. LHD-90]|uniref:Crp/Fnr family transcriptional regulator n=1 Tax=Mesorhizobium sp. LHD-90 TaxID=3071414 RepID=UPI0027E1BC5E|nr:Crp/Fnr family transcriptional regulator [Mesorhizobium sp. LHD-90]MDQ6433593.1 Crp/Fnr family transcriptional regulator [Mesorhizobium sp. LHD-90]
MVECPKCPLHGMKTFRAFTAEELAFVSGFKRGELAVEKGATIIMEGHHNAHLYTVLSGWAFRYKLLPDGKRQILNYLMPGDLAGLQGSLLGEMQHSVEALSPMRLCVFERDKLYDLYRNHTGLAFDVTWIAAREEQILDENLLSLGRRSAIERAAYLIAFIGSRARNAGLNGTTAAQIPMTQQLLADTLGLSLVHTNKTIRKLVDRKLIGWREGGCEIKDMKGLLALARWGGIGETPRPFI